MEKLLASSATTNSGAPYHSGIPSTYAPVRCASSSAVSSVDFMAGKFWVGTKIVFIVSSLSLQMNDSPRQPIRHRQAKPSRQGRQDTRPKTFLKVASRATHFGSIKPGFDSPLLSQFEISGGLGGGRPYWSARLAASFR